MLHRMGDFDYTAPAELFVGKGRGSARGSPMAYKRFSTSAEAIKYAAETLDALSLASAALVVGEDRYDGPRIRELYDDTRYPSAGVPDDRAGSRSSAGRGARPTRIGGRCSRVGVASGVARSDDLVANA